MVRSSSSQHLTRGNATVSIACGLYSHTLLRGCGAASLEVVTGSGVRQCGCADRGNTFGKRFADGDLDGIDDGTGGVVDDKHHDMEVVAVLDEGRTGKFLLRAYHVRGVYAVGVAVGLAVADTGVPQGDGGGDIAGLEGADIHRGIPP